MPALTGRTIAVLETRENELFAELLQAHGAQVFSCPLVGIVDAPDVQAVQAWLRKLAGGQFHDLILMTGEGVRRLLKCASAMGIGTEVLNAMQRARKITRGPKPARVLTENGLRVDVAAEEATTDGLMRTISRLDIAGHNIGVQLFGEDPSQRLLDYLTSRQAVPVPIVAYIYVPQADDQRCAELITQMAAGQIDVLAFTSASQVKRLHEAAAALTLTHQLAAGLSRTKVAAIGPVVSAELRRYGINVAITPSERSVLKQFVADICAFCAAP